MNAHIGARLLLGQKLVEMSQSVLHSALGQAERHAQSKGPGDLVTQTDLAIETALRREITNRFADDNIVGEEFGGSVALSGFTWLIDPVDGTVNFARGLDYCCISIALLRHGIPIASWISDPRHNELFWADPDGRAYLNSSAITCSAPVSAEDAVIGLGFSPRHPPELPAGIVGPLMRSGFEFRRFGAGALSLAHVAAGRLDAYLEPHMNPWDAVGGLYLSECAGATTMDFVGSDGLAHGAPVFAASPSIAQQLLALLPAPFSGTPPHRQNVMRSAGEAAT